MSDKLKEIGLNPVTESFVFAPHASIGGLPYAGWAGIIGCVLTVLATILASLSAYAGLAMHFVCTMYMICTWIWLVVSVFKYHTCFDWCFKHKVSHNTYAELLPEDGKYDYTIFLSGHTDTSWTLKLSASQNKLGFVGVVLRLALGAIAVAAVTIVSVVMLILIMMLNYGTDTLSYDTLVNTAKAYYVIKQMTLYSSPIVIICAFLLTMYNEKTEAIASPGAMDNATGVSIAYQVVKYYKENPDKMPKNCRIVDCNIGAEESGLRGSIAFTRKHKNDGMLDNAYHINIDSVADKDHFEVIHGDSWLCPHFDKDLERMFKEAMREAGIKIPAISQTRRRLRFHAFPKIRRKIHHFRRSKSRHEPLLSHLPRRARAFLRRNGGTRIGRGAPRHRQDRPRAYKIIEREGKALLRFCYTQSRRKRAFCY